MAWPVRRRSRCRNNPIPWQTALSLQNRRCRRWRRTGRLVSSRALGRARRRIINARRRAKSRGTTRNVGSRTVSRPRESLPMAQKRPRDETRRPRQPCLPRSSSSSSSSDSDSTGHRTISSRSSALARVTRTNILILYIPLEKTAAKARARAMTAMGTIPRKAKTTRGRTFSRGIVKVGFCASSWSLPC